MAPKNKSNSNPTITLELVKNKTFSDLSKIKEADMNLSPVLKIYTFKYFLPAYSYNKNYKNEGVASLVSITEKKDVPFATFELRLNNIPNETNFPSDAVASFTTPLETDNNGNYIFKSTHYARLNYEINNNPETKTCVVYFETQTEPKKLKFVDLQSANIKLTLLPSQN